MKILFNCLTLEKGGAERVISVLANGLSNINDIAICTLKNTDIKYELKESIKIYKVDRRKDCSKNIIEKTLSKISIIRFINMIKIILDFNPDIIISFLPEPSFRLMILKKISKRIKKIPVIVSIRNDPKTEYKNMLIKQVMKSLYRDLDGLVLQTGESKKYFERELSSVKNKIVIPNPISEKFMNKKTFEVPRKKIIVSVGRLEKQKNHQMLIEAFSKFIKENNDFTLKIYGQGSLYENLKNIIKNRNVEKFIKLEGNKDNIEKHINDASCFVLSSDYEGMPNALMEAMALGIPCISTDCPCGGPKELIQDGINGLLTPVNDIYALKEKMNLLCNDIELQKILSKNAYETMKEYYPEIIIKKWEDFIYNIIEK